MPAPFAAHSPGTITIGSASKSFWGGLRLGWIRAPHECLDVLQEARLALDLGAPVLEQLTLARLLETGPVLPGHVEQLRAQRDRLVAEMTARLPEWRFHVPGGGLALWIELPSARGSALAAAAEQHGVIVAPGPVFAAEGGLDRFVRVPWTRRPDELALAVERLARAWTDVRDAPASRVRRGTRVMVA